MPKGADKPWEGRTFTVSVFKVEHSFASEWQASRVAQALRMRGYLPDLQGTRVSLSSRLRNADKLSEDLAQDKLRRAFEDAAEFAAGLRRVAEYRGSRRDASQSSHIFSMIAVVKWMLPRADREDIARDLREDVVQMKAERHWRIWIVTVVLLEIGIAFAQRFRRTVKTSKLPRRGN